MSFPRLAVVLACVLSGCSSAPGKSELSLTGASSVRDDGSPARFSAFASDSSGNPGVGAVSFSSTAGTLSAASVELVDGLARVELRCAADAGCPVGLTVTASWRELTASKDLRLVHVEPVDAGGVDAGGPDAGGTDAGGVDAGGTDAGGVDGGGSDAGETDAGPPPTLADVTGRPPYWWRQDGGVYAVPAEEQPSYTCTGWAGEAHPGYTLPDGEPFAVGCDGDPVDFFFIESTSPTAIDVCGTVHLAEPMEDPVYPRALLLGQFVTTEVVAQGAWRLQCLRDSFEVRYRFQVEPDAGLFLGAGARTPGFARSLFGWYDGTVTAPITSPDAGRRIVLGDAGVTGLDFGVGPGRMPGDP